MSCHSTVFKACCAARGEPFFLLSSFWDTLFSCILCIMTKVVVGIISRTNDSGEAEFLLVSSKKDFGQYTGLFYPPGGKMEAGETEEVALAREIQEELGLDVRLVEKVAETSGDLEGQVTTWWKCEVDTLKLQVNEEEIAEVRWFTQKELLTSHLLWPATKKFFAEYLI